MPLLLTCDPEGHLAYGRGGEVIFNMLSMSEGQLI